ncbi:hypothetical protein B0I35DRAFT_39090 [Stachybotrys elegans]|uniref:Nonsense-mediated mRNA decay factor n=1 Tax=Stachybotrys elegans TaxID=80388 RepID=A0A8K0T8C9_9HYPO|nr:hypothetical protein B0I35DRAFT_39090 [Stachybotrys elegans]
MATSAPQPRPASLTFHQAREYQKRLADQLERMQSDSSAGTDLVQFETVDGLLEKLRLACVQTIFLDFEYAVKKNVEHVLWEPHTSINTEYRRVLRRLRNSPNAVEKRKVEKMYNNFLRIAQKFYKGYIQRLVARYDVPELKRVAKGIEMELLPTQDSITPPTALHAKVLNSCHATLLRLGDLARYRVQARHKKSGYETALTFYGLAHDLIPDSGYAFHQMSIVSMDEGNNLDMFYHLYRSWAAIEPHPHAKSNIETRFKTLGSQSSSRNHGRSSSEDVFVMWFVKLHALFYKGEVFSQHKELEGEVMHRLEKTARTPNSSNILLKMILFNMSAYHIASVRFAETQSAEASRFGQFTLTLNVRFILVLSSILESELRESQSKETLNDGESAGSEPIIENLLPLLRTYCMWLGARRADFFGTSDSAGGMAYSLIQSLSRVFTLLCVETYRRDNPATCPYLLSEDLEIRGFQPLYGQDVPEPCRAYNGEEGTLKPFPPPEEQRMGHSGEALARILDILRCAYFLAEDPTIPLVHRIVDNQLVFEFESSPQPPQQSNNSNVATHDASMDIPAELESSLPLQPQQVLEFDSPVELEANGTPLAAAAEPAQLSEEEEAGESTVFSMVAPFLKPPVTEPHQCRSPGLQSNGMPSPAVNAAFNSMQPEPSPTGSVTGGTYAALPWDWVFTPRPRVSQERLDGDGQEAFLTHRSPTQLSRRAADDPFNSPKSPLAAFAPHMTSSASRSPAIPEDLHRQQLLQAFGSPSLPRATVAGGWSSGQELPRKASSPATYGSHAMQNMVSSSSAFSNLSSLYLGTPVNGPARRVSTPYGLAGREAEQSSQRDVSSRRYQMDNTASQYDAAILNAAHGNAR